MAYMSAKAGRILNCSVCGAEKYVPRPKLERFRYCSRSCLAVAKAEQMRGNSFASGRGANATSFQAGIVPWNNGTSGVMRANSGSFRDGEPGPKAVPTGTVTLRIDGNGTPRNWIKTDSGWRPYAQHVWEESFGAIPEGKVVHHRDHDSINDVPENLQLVTRSEHIRVHRPLAI